MRENLSRNAQRRKSVYDARVREKTYSVGESVWYYYPRKYTKKSPKWQRNYVGPYRVVKVIEPVNYVLQKSPKSAPFVVHADKLKKCFSPTTPDWTHSAEENTAPTVEPAALVPANAEVSTPRKRGRPRKESQPLPEVESQTNVEEDAEVEESLTRTPRQRRPPAHLSEYLCHRVQSPDTIYEDPGGHSDLQNGSLQF